MTIAMKDTARTMPMREAADYQCCHRRRDQHPDGHHTDNERSNTAEAVSSVRRRQLAPRY
jgi:hypothetical protein